MVRDTLAAAISIQDISYIQPILAAAMSARHHRSKVE
jgi:hypothetical protein